MHFCQLFKIMLTILQLIPVRKSPLSCAVCTFIHIAIDLAQAPTAAKKESLLEKAFCKSSPGRSQNLTLSSRVVRPGSIPELPSNLKK